MNAIHESMQPILDEYQERFVRNVRRVVETNWWRRRPMIRILDMGCDTSGRQMAHLAMLTRGEVVGINIPEAFPTAEAKRVAGPRAMLVRMDGMNLEFPDNSFDLVISANVMEHVSDPIRYIREAARVTKPGGLSYFETAPVWSSARGHHVMESMIAENCPQETSFKDDGSIIPDWAHLKFDESKMREQINGKLKPETVEYILWYLYRSGDLNKTPWNVIREALEASFSNQRIATWAVDRSDNSRMPTDGNQDYNVYGFSAVCSKRPQSGIARRLIWRLRKCGF